ncbi:unnamed protein product [Spirodela intermedia]|uniref:Uncharacterized protein n=1 Tax=Spirodela intermedia TaxID=51605 RepID=A0A7I8KBK2_SPIIN|nr:unnamed protein product [Spirodela intermedia]
MRSWASGASIFTQPEERMGIKKLAVFSIAVSVLVYLLLVIPSLTARSPPSTVLRPAKERPYPVSFAYLISLSKGDVDQVKRMLGALYHPGNHYLLHLDSEASEAEHAELVTFVSVHPVFREVGNIWIVQKSNLVTYRGPTMLANTLHAMAMLLKACEWEWFVNLSAADYPLITQDDLIYAFSELPRGLNFIQHSSQLGWKRNKRGKPIIMDPGLYSRNKSEIIWLPKQRSQPTAFKLFTGSAWTVVSRAFAEYCIIGWDNLPRTLLLYYTNFISSPEGYFQTVACNSMQFRNSTVNHDLHYITWDNPPKQHPQMLGMKDFRRMIISSAPFARKFRKDDPVLGRIDREILKRSSESFAYGGWCAGSGGGACFGDDWRKNVGVMKPGPGGRRLKALLGRITSVGSLRSRQCR